ncbi:S8 family serine peptidase [Streptomyces huiliensis]|uniref:S8 family serine peptidase n=1 Tax=Streptomyces huiliensis TaxID=2876027 RepID=UPI001CC0C071|nr:S8 family serine peptidase [Streptomyces huiliensis]MBZ4320175.1 S8 family serine peptidase [Streptomyces huiliensis]
MEYRKLAPSLAAAYQRYHQDDVSSLRRQSASLGWVSVDEPAKPTRAVVSLICTPDATLDDVKHEGLRINQGGNRIRTAIVPFDGLETLAEHDGVERIVSAHLLRPYLDAARAGVGVDTFQNTTGLTGKDVLVGIVDTGIDPHHPAFTGRIERIWDQTLHGHGVPEGAFGLELKGSQLTQSRDTEGHGSHVSGISAGAEPVFRGVAPDARIVAVKTNFLDSGITAGIQYVFRLGREMGLPTVVNLSLGGHYDPHDGSDALSLSVDEETGPGRLVCCAAGNEGTDDIHARVPVHGTAVKSLPCIPDVKGRRHDFMLNGWYATDSRFEVAVAAPSGHSTDFQGPIPTTENSAMTYDLPDGKVEIATPETNTLNDDRNFFIMVRPEEHSLAPGLLPTWQLLVRGVGAADRGTVDVWILDKSGHARFNGPMTSDDMKIGSPGCASSAITVAAYATRTTWEDIDHDTFSAPWLRLDDIADFSSEGPLRDGARKPDVTAPGAMIVSALSQDSAPERELTLDTEHVAMQGTSMACPFLAGVCALLLERDGDLDPARVKELLKAHSARPHAEAGEFDEKWGFGLLDVAGL